MTKTYTDWQPTLDSLRQKVQEEMLNLPDEQSIALFYEPIYYINRMSGKKLRPLLTILCGKMLGGKEENLIYPAAAIEMLHNFTLVHDDIMDNDETRRNNPTVHVKWDLGTAILAGDGMLGLAYQKLLNTPITDRAPAVQRFTEAMLEICEGQALDKTFETAGIVDESNYLEMIGKKTAVLIQLSCEMGGLVTGANQDQLSALKDFGFNTGMGFQIQDDLLDILADEMTLGKKVGSDLAMNKQTILTIRLREAAPELEQASLSLESFKKVLEEQGILDSAIQLAESYFKKAKAALNFFDESDSKAVLASLLDYIRDRDK